MKTALTMPVLLLGAALAACGPGTPPGNDSSMPGNDASTGMDSGGGGNDSGGGGDGGGCASATDCASCTRMGTCGWCSNTNQCYEGTSTGPTGGACMTAQWSWLSSQCGGDGGGMTGTPLTIAGGVRTCTAGMPVVVGCNQGCAMPIGMCSGDPVLRICPGSATTTVCTSSMSIDESDDSLSDPACGGSSDAGTTDPDGGVNVRLCPVSSFMCPADGMYTIWTGAFGTRQAMCMPAVR